jgi:hypothetical protein
VNPDERKKNALALRKCLHMISYISTYFLTAEVRFYVMCSSIECYLGERELSQLIINPAE